MDNSIVEIKNYILFLKQNCNLEISLHPFGNEQLISNSELNLFNIHENPYCVYVKTFPGAKQHCLDCQNKVFDKCNAGSFCGTCYAGVREFVYPIYDNNLLVGFISVSGYKDTNHTSYIERCANKFAIPKKDLCQNILSLKTKMPDKDYVDTLIIPLTRMLELAYSKPYCSKISNSIINEVITYINRHYSENITIEHICKNFSCSRSYICHAFKKETGRTPHEHLTAVRIRSAKSLLLYSNLSISEIAFSVGFNDSNYFSNTFKKCVGVSPRDYRKEEHGST